ncbi:hypothetical protein HanIR_Chr10g0470341 [Helianthus annuus]|nr:hypothetical protein HanIR_Chr10g0470341 [Helianthus annuus]
MELLNKSFEFTPRKKKWLILLAICGFSTYGIYNLPSVSRKRKRLVKLFAGLIAIVDILSDSSEILVVVSRDLKEFLASDCNKIPNSLNQLSKIAVSDEFSKSLTGVFEAATLGVVQGCYEEQKGENSNASFKQRVIDRLMSESGTGFVSLVVGSIARNLVLGLGLDSNGSYESGLKLNLSTDLPELVDVLCTDKSKMMVGDLIKTVVSTAVAVYLDRPTSVNVYDGMFSRITDPNHQKHVKDIVVYVFKGAVETLVKTSHQVLTS